MKSNTHQVLIGQIRIAKGIRRVNGQGDAVRKYRHKDEPFEGSTKLTSMKIERIKENISVVIPALIR